MLVRRRTKTYGFLFIGPCLIASLCRAMPFDVFQATFLPFLPRFTALLGPWLGLGPAFALIGPSWVGRLRALLAFIQPQLLFQLRPIGFVFLFYSLLNRYWLQ